MLLSLRIPDDWETQIEEYRIGHGNDSRHRAILSLLAEALAEHHLMVELPPERGRYVRHNTNANDDI